VRIGKMRGEGKRRSKGTRRRKEKECSKGARRRTEQKCSKKVQKEEGTGGKRREKGR
jgi:hypothetical protein